MDAGTLAGIERNYVIVDLLVDDKPARATFLKEDVTLCVDGTWQVHAEKIIKDLATGKEERVPVKPFDVVWLNLGERKSVLLPPTVAEAVIARARATILRITPR